jgi:hypothetical protein
VTRQKLELKQGKPVVTRQKLELKRASSRRRRQFFLSPP